MTDADRLRELADTLDECEWNHPLGSANLCRQMANNFTALHEALEMLIRVQNGPPLHKYHDEWHDAMIAACEATGQSLAAQWYREQKQERKRDETE